MRRTRLKRGLGGFTLVEMMVSVALVSLVMVAVSALVLSAARFSIRAMESATAQGAVIKVFRVLDDDIALARAFPEEAQGYRASPDTLILEDDSGRRTAYIAAEGNLERLALDEENPRRVVLARGLGDFRFERQGRRVVYRFSTYLKNSGQSRSWEGCAVAGLD